MKSPGLPRRSVDHTLDLVGGSPKMGLTERLKQQNKGKKMSAPALMITKADKNFLGNLKPSPNSSTDTSPNGTLEKLKKRRSPALPASTESFEEELSRRLDKSENNSQTTSASSKPPILPPPRKGDIMAGDSTSADDDSGSPESQVEASSLQLRSGGFILKGRILPPPPSRPPPKLKLDKPPPLPPKAVVK